MVVPSLFVYVPVNVPSELTVSLTCSSEEVGPDDRILPSHVPARSANEVDVDCWVNIMRPDEPSGNVSVQEIMELLESAMHSEVVNRPFTLIAIPFEEIDKEPEGLSEAPLLCVPEPVKVPSRATVNVPLSHHGAPGPEIKLLKFHVPEKS